MDVLVDIRVSMPMMSIIVMQKLGIMHLLIGLESLVTHVMGSIENFLVEMGLQKYDIHDLIHTNGYHMVMGFDLLLKIRVVVDLKC